MDFQALMNKAKANTDKERASALAKNAELEAQRRREAEQEVARKRQDEERRRKEAEARLKREHENRLIEERLARERERKKLDRLKEEQRVQDEAANARKKASTSKTTSTMATLPTSTVRLPSVALKKKRKRDALFSDDDDDASDSSRRSGVPRAKTASTLSRGKHRLAASSAADLAGMSAKDRLKAEFDPSKPIMLNVNKRDTRTIEEIEADLKRKKELANGGSVKEASPAPKGLFASRKGQVSTPLATTASGTASSSASQPKPQAAAVGPSKSTTTKPAAVSGPGKPAVANRPNGAAAAKKASRAQSDSPPPRKRFNDRVDRPSMKDVRRSYSPEPARRRPPVKGTSKSKEQARREAIWKILNPDKEFPGYRDYASDEIDDDSDDMEAGYDELEAEDFETDKIARREDRLEQARLEARAKEKEELRRRKEGKGKSKA